MAKTKSDLEISERKLVNLEFEFKLLRVGTSFVEKMEIQQKRAK